MTQRRLVGDLVALDGYDPLSVATAETNPRAVIGGNQPPVTPEQAIFQEINDLYDEARNWADGEPITSTAMHDSVSQLYDGLHEAGKRADAIRVEKKKPHDDAVKAIQEAFNPYIQAKRGKVDMGKAALGDLLAVWRAAVAKKKADEAAAARVEADRIAAEAQAAIRASTGNLEQREKAEELLAEAKKVERFARRQDKAATVGTGLRTVWTATIDDTEAALDWAYGRSPGEFNALAQKIADEVVRGGLRSIPGFVVAEEKRAA